MNKETTEFLRSIFTNNNLVLDQAIPDQIYQEVVHPVRHLIKTKKYIPIDDLLSISLIPIPWESIGNHPGITLKIIKEHFLKLNFKDMVSNPKVELEQLCLIVNQNTFNESKSALVSKSKVIFESSRITANLILKFSEPGFKLGSDTLNTLDFTGILEQDKIKILKMYHGNSVDYILILIKAGFSHYVFCNLIQLFFKSGACQDARYTYHNEIAKLYLNKYQSSPNFIRNVVLFYKLLSSRGAQYSTLGSRLGNELALNSETRISDLKYLIQRKIITHFPYKQKYRSMASFFYQELLKGNINVDSVVEDQLTLAERNYVLDKVISRYSLRSFSLTSLSQIKYLMHPGVQSHNLRAIMITFLNKYYDYPQIINDFYVNIKKNTPFYTTFIGINLNLCQTKPLSETFLVLYLPDYLSRTNSSSGGWHTFCFKFNKLSPECLGDVVSMSPSPLLKQIINQISIYQTLTPEFINKYSSLLNWNLLKFNEVWTKYPHDLFKKLPVFNQENFWLWASTEEKMKKITSFKLPEGEIYQWDQDPDWIVVSHALAHHSGSIKLFCFHILCSSDIKCSHNACKILKSDREYYSQSSYQIKYYLGTQGRRNAIKIRFHLNDVVLEVIKKEVHLKTNSLGIKM